MLEQRGRLELRSRLVGTPRKRAGDDVSRIEEWRPWPRDDRYEVSSMGRVRSFAALGRRPKNGTPRSARPRILAEATSQHGYRQVNPGTGHAVQVHLMVLETFVGKRPVDCPEVAHFDGDKTNNRVDNLRYCTRKENAADTRRHGRLLLGERHPGAKLTRVQAQEILDLAAMPGKRPSQSAVAARYGVSPGLVQCIWSRRQWKSLDDTGSR